MKEATPETSPVVIGLKADLQSLDLQLFRLAQRAYAEGYIIVITAPDGVTDIQAYSPGHSDIEMRLDKRWDLQ
jgi:hypothetical protein